MCGSAIWKGYLQMRYARQGVYRAHDPESRTPVNIMMGAVGKLRSLVPAPIRNIYYLLFRVKLRLWCRYKDIANSKSGYGAFPPALLRFRVSENLSAQEFSRVGEKCAALIKQHVESMEMDLSTARRVLDFGCGCGRTARWLLQQYPNV